MNAGIVPSMVRADPILALCIARALEREGADTTHTQEAAIAVLTSQQQRKSPNVDPASHAA